MVCSWNDKHNVSHASISGTELHTTPKARNAGRNKQGRVSMTRRAEYSAVWNGGEGCEQTPHKSIEIDRQAGESFTHNLALSNREEANHVHAPCTINPTPS